MPIISVIVPVYKTEKYLDRCIESIISQTLDDLEILLIDDGSPDKSGVICDEWAKRDNRIKVIHKLNGGLSDARNCGLEAAIGDYVAFIDSDDWIDSDMFEILYKTAVEYNADIAECSWRCIYSDRIEEQTENTGKIVTGDNIFALRGELRCEYFNAIACNKIYDRRKIFYNVRYPIGKLHEDEFTTHKAFYNADKLVYVDASKYNYDRTREDSITAAFKERNLDVIDALYERLIFFYEKGLEELQVEMENFYFWILLDRLYQCSKAGIYTDRVKQLIDKTNKDYFLNIELNISQEMKFELSLLKNSYKLFIKCRESAFKRRWVNFFSWIYVGQYDEKEK